MEIRVKKVITRINCNRSLVHLRLYALLHVLSKPKIRILRPKVLIPPMYSSFLSVELALRRRVLRPNAGRQDSSMFLESLHADYGGSLHC